MTVEMNALLATYDLDGANQARLQKASKMVMALLPEVLDHFYDRVGREPEMAAFFKSDKMLERAKGEQLKHWSRLFSGEYCEDYQSSARNIGQVHTRIGLPFSFFNAGYAHANAQIQALILKRQTGGLFRRASETHILLGILSRAMALDIQLIFDAHAEAVQEEQNRGFRYMTDAIEALAAQDLSHDIPSPENSDFPEQFNGIRESFNAAIGALRQVISGIRTSAQQLDSGALEVSQASQDLSQRTESQAATLEQTAAAVEEITVSMRSSAEATQQTSGAVDTTRQRAEEGSVVVRNAVEKMNEIADSSAQISKIISVIDDISFQTNLLALNAGVEAARAGESGRGFAVVASEVRNLAQRTADSAGEIKELIDISTKHVESGVELVGNAGEMLESIVNHINEAADLTQQVASSAEQQSTAFGEINIGVSQLDSVTQQNAAMVEQSTAALMEMRNEASTLSGLVSVFQLGSGSQSGGFEGAQDAAFRNVG
ncbi:methyl-accepting chemotaxis sensory transducer [Tritonibacter mobilis]|uniref:globin-coupled sensor protein n=1 Tax=Tritonibacter mobilis TaxID=379347 RepID=UPI000F71A607|nr:globin-coupled sensor protein [Tritonibacter mobilis]VCU58078.1 methyl-accepting chemotaxis sensory transducer [Tritonibacter mobilis]